MSTSTRISGLLVNVSEEFLCKCEDGNRADPFAVAMVREEAIVGHVQKICVCSLYLRQELWRPEVAYNAICFTLYLKLFCDPCARIKILTCLKFRT